MSLRGFSPSRGFTLIEMAVVMVISGLITAAGFQTYKIFMKQKYNSEAYEKQRLIATSLAIYRFNQSALPCPADPRTPMTSTNAGYEISPASCSSLRSPTTPVGTCLEGVCKALGRDTKRDVDTFGDPVLIGAIPFADIKNKSTIGARMNDNLTYKDVLDPWGYQMTYIVSGYLTDSSNFDPNYGAVYIKTAGATPVDIVDPPGSGWYALVSHGDNHLGAHTTDGAVAVPCAGVSADVPNCDGNGVVAVGVRTLKNDATYYDDVVFHESNALQNLWQATGMNIYNVNPGNVGIGVTNPQNKLEVDGNIQATDITQDFICDSTGGVLHPCWSPNAFASKTTDTCVGPGGVSAPCTPLQCPPSGTPGMINALRGIVGDASKPNGLAPVCALVPMTLVGSNQSCAPVVNGSGVSVPTYAVGFDSLGALVCEPAAGTYP